jgi:hypothetical protein
MASNKKVITLGLDYSNFDGGITEVNRKMGLLDSEFRLATEQTKAFGTETDQLTLKQEALTQKINLVTQKVNLSKDAYDKAVASGKATDKQLDNLQKAYVNNQTSLQKLNNELAENKSRVDKANTSTNTFGGSIRGMASSLGINVSPALEAVASKFDGLDKNVGNAILGIGVIVTAFAGCTISAANMADELLELSSVTGITTNELQKMQYASKFLDVDVSEMTGAMTKLTRSMDDARKGSKELDGAFDKLHVRYKDGNDILLDSQDVFYKTIDALGKVKNETERDALSMTLLGKSAKELNPLIEAGSARLKELGIEAEDMGTIMSGQSLEDLGEFKDKMDKMNATFDAAKTKLGLVLLPVLTVFADWISDSPTPVLAGVATFAALVVVFGLLAKAAQGMAVANALLSVSNVTVGTTGAVATAGMGPLLLILLAVAAAIALIVGGAVGIKSAMDEVKNSTAGIVNTTNAAVTSAQSASYSSSRTISYPQSELRKVDTNASGTDYFEGGETWVGENGPEIRRFPRGTQIFSNAESRAMTSGGDTYYVTIDAKNVREFQDMVQIFSNLKQTTRQGVLSRG